MTAPTRRTLLRCCAAGTGVSVLSLSAQAQTNDVITTDPPQEVPPTADAVIAGETTLSDDATLTVTARSALGVSPSFLIDEEISPTDGTWRATLNMSLTEIGDTFTLSIRHTDGPRLLEEDWIVVDPDLFFTIELLTLNLEDGGSQIRTLGERWRQEIAPVAPDETLTLDVRIRDDDGELIFFSDAETIDLETDGGITATADGMSITLTGTEPGEATLQITIESDRNPDFQAPPLSLTVAEPQDTPSDNESATESDDTPDGDDDDDADGDDAADETTTTDSTTDDTAATEPSEPSDATADSVPGFTVPGTLAALGGGVYLIRERLGRSRR